MERINEEEKEKITADIEELKRLEESIREDLEEAKTRLKERDKINFDYLDGQKITGTTSGTIGTQTSHSHNLNRAPKFVFITSTSNGVVYRSATSDSSNIYVKGSASSVTFDAYLIS